MSRSEVDDVVAGLDEEYDDLAPMSEGALVMQELIDRHRDPTLHEIQDPRHARLIKEMEYLAHANIADVYTHQIVKEYVGQDDDGEPVFEDASRLVVADILTLPEHVQRAIKKVKVTTKDGMQVVEVEMYDKTVAADKLFRHHGLFSQDNEQQAASMQDGLLELLFGTIGAAGLPKPSTDPDD